MTDIHAETSRPGPLERWGLSGRAIVRAWADLTGTRQKNLAQNINPDLPNDDLALVGQQIDACLSAKGGAVSARNQAAELGRAYLNLNDQGKQRFFSLLETSYGDDRTAVTEAAQSVAFAETDEAFAKALDGLRASLSSPRRELLRQFNSLEEGVKFLVDMRADLLSSKDNRKAFRALDGELHRLLASWFDVGFLELQRITWKAPAALLEKLVTYEAVHEIRSWDDLKNRLDSDRRCYAFFHPAMPQEPLIFVEVALVNGMSANVHELLDEDAPSDDPQTADTAIFYSISNAQAGLAGVSFGDFLIKRVVSVLSHDLPKLKTFATLSPIPGFRAWLKGALNGPVPLLNAAEAQTLGELSGGQEPAGILLEILEQPDWFKYAETEEALKPILMRLCAQYLLNERRENPIRTRDPVAHFHLSNGSRVEQLNWLADTSPKGLAQSAGLMVNYRYRLNDIESNHEKYKGKGVVTASNGIKALAT